ncbi:MAG: hypothetical protein WBB69_00030 [Anaerolineales bacterium]
MKQLLLAVVLNDQDLINQIDNECDNIIYFWVSLGAKLYGLDWLKKNSIERSKLADKTICDSALQAIKNKSNYFSSISENDEEIIELSKWIEDTCGQN